MQRHLISFYARAVRETVSAFSERRAYMKPLLTKRVRTELSAFCQLIGLERLNTHTYVSK